ncbi:hypothetical protein MPSEU_000924700 [Mayamaea pseudoterrestris]|nr:hypothetical protein MPSEU_000924700 [Mayamaea pseudoterrestris]
MRENKFDCCKQKSNDSGGGTKGEGRGVRRIQLATLTFYTQQASIMSSTTNEATNIAAMDANNFTLIIKLSSGVKFTVILPSPPPLPGYTVHDVKQAFHQSHPETPVTSQKLIYKGRILDNDKNLQEFGIVSQCTLFLIVSSASQTPLQKQETTTTAADCKTTESAAAATATTTLDPSPPADSLSALMQNMLGGGDGNSARNSSNTNSHLQQMLNDPGAMQQAMEMMRNPDALAQAMRQQDLAMSQLENMPGGFSALRSMYDSMHSLEDDLYLPTTSSSSSSSSSNSGAAGGVNAGAAGTAMPNPWGSSSSNTNANNATYPNQTVTTPFANPFSSAGANPFAANNSDNSNPLAQAMRMMDGSAAGSSQLPTPPFPMQADSLGLSQQLLQQYAQNNPDRIRQHLMQQDSFLGQFFETMSTEQANQFIQNIVSNWGAPASAPLGNMQSLMQQQQNGAGGVDEMLQQIMMMDDFVMPNAARGPVTSQANPWATIGSSESAAAATNDSAAVPHVPLDISSLLNAQQRSPSLTGSSQPAIDPTTRFQRQLQSLRDMGFDQDDRNVQALTTVGGNVNRAVDWLLLHPAQSTDDATTTTTRDNVEAEADDAAGAATGTDRDEGEGSNE